MHDWFGFIADTYKILIPPDFSARKLVEKYNSDNITALLSEELKVFPHINPHNILMKLTSREVISIL